MPRKVIALVIIMALAMAAHTSAQEKLAEVKKVQIGSNAEFRVNDEPFFPIIAWLQNPENFDILRQTNFNTIAGYHWNKEQQRGLGGTTSVAEYGAKVWQAGFYFVGQTFPSGTEEATKAIPGLLAWIHEDEPDLTQTRTEANVAPAEHMKVNSGSPFSRIVDGTTNSWTVVQPMAGGEFTIINEKPVTAVSLAVWSTISAGLAVAREIEILGDGKSLLTATLENKAGQQKFTLDQPATFKELTVRIISEYPGDREWGSIGEVEAFDAAGTNLLLRKPYTVPKMSLEEVIKDYQTVKNLDPDRPMLMTITAGFMKHMTRYTDAQKQEIYPNYVKHCDVIGFDIYPIYGYNTPSKITWVADGVTELRAIAGPKKPIYAWIETNKGSMWISYERQIEVRPEMTRAQVWMAIIRGATGIGYFTHAYRPEYTQFAPKGDMVKELTRLNAQITRLAPAILADEAKTAITMTMNDQMDCHFKATESGGSLHIFAQILDLGKDAHKLGQHQDITPRGGTATITVAGLKAGTPIEVVEENRTITATEGQFTDTFTPLATRIYRLPIPTR